MGYWLIHQHNFAPKVRAYYSQDNEHHRAFMMRLKEGFIRYEDLDTAGKREEIQHFEEIEPLLK